MNESECIITSLNLYEFSQVNNNEMGIHINRNVDNDIYKDTYEEAQRIIRISDEVRISLDKVIDDNKKIENTGNTEKKLSTSKLALKHKLKTPQFLSLLTEKEYLSFDNDNHELTKKGIQIGGEHKKSKRFGGYFIWPESLLLES